MLVPLCLFQAGDNLRSLDIRRVAKLHSCQSLICDDTTVLLGFKMRAAYLTSHYHVKEVEGDGTNFKWILMGTSKKQSGIHEEILFL